MNSQLAPTPAKTFRVRGDQIDQQHSADEMSARENRNSEAAPFRRPPNQHALEITLLCFMNSEMNLRQRAGENKRHPGRETNDRQLQRRE